MNINIMYSYISVEKVKCSAFGVEATVYLSSVL